MGSSRSHGGDAGGTLLPVSEFQAIRSIPEHICRKFRYAVGTDRSGKPIQIAPYFDNKGNMVAQKLRGKNKDFKFIGQPKQATLFGQQLWQSGGKRVVITEGEIDALSYATVTGAKWPVVSVPNGAQGAAKSIKENIEWLESFGEVVLMFDADDPGRKAAIEVAELFTPGRAKIVDLPLKDANEMLVARRVEELSKSIWQAREFRPDGVVCGDEVTLEDVTQAVTPGYRTNYPKFDARLRGLRKGELTMLTAGSGIGKSTWARELAYHLHQAHGLTIGNIYLEEQYVKTAQGYVAIHNNVPLGALRENPSCLSTQRWTDSLSSVIQKRMFFYRHFGSLDSDVLLGRIRYMAAAGCDFVVLDHISIVVSGMESSREGERRDIDRLMTALCSLIQQTGIGIIAITHLKQPDGSPHEEGGRVTLSHLRGSGALKQLSDNVVALERNQQDEERQDESLVRILKNREFGDVGPCDTLLYNRATGRLLPTTETTSGQVKAEVPPWEDDDKALDF